jgi:paraquat-inducible protein B
MSKKANPTVVGAFTIGALVILVAIILIFGSDRFMKHAVECVLYFDASVSGLDIGAPVMFRGVKIGAVKDIKLVYDAEKDEFRIPVVIELYEGSSVQLSGETILDADHIKDLVEKGARAQLNSQSLLTGKLDITVDFYPKMAARFVSDHTGLPQIPTIPTPFQAFYQKVSDLPLEEIVQDVRTAMQGISEIVNSADTKAVIENLNATLANTKEMIKSIQTEFVPVAKSMQETSLAAQKSLEAATEALKQVEESLDSDSPLRYQTAQLLESLKTASDNIARLADSIERHPESMLKGKPQEERY